MTSPTIFFLILLGTGSIALADESATLLDPTEFAPDITSAPLISAQTLVDSLRRRRDAKSGRERGAQHRSEFDQARGYLRGVKDGGTDVAWCAPSRLPAHEVDGEIIGYLAKLPPGVRAGEAAPLIKAALRTRFPCPVRKKP
jgi:hypothetical protein